MAFLVLRVYRRKSIKTLSPVGIVSVKRTFVCPRMYSRAADYVGVTLKTIAGVFGDKPICFFLQGADGDINPYYAATPITQDAAQKLDWTGRKLGMEAVRVAQDIRTNGSAVPRLDFADDSITFPLRWDPQKFHDDLIRVNGPAVFQD